MTRQVTQPTPEELRQLNEALDKAEISELEIDPRTHHPALWVEGVSTESFDYMRLACRYTPWMLEEIKRLRQELDNAVTRVALTYVAPLASMHQQLEEQNQRLQQMLQGSKK